MVAPAFECVPVGSYDEAVRLLAARNKAGGDEAKILAGGQSLMPMLNLRLAHPGLLIDINPADQRPPTLGNETLRLPALTRHRVLLEDPVVLGPVLDPPEPARSDLLKSLAVLSSTRFNVAESARILHHHYNTMRYRVTAWASTFPGVRDIAPASQSFLTRSIA